MTFEEWFTNEVKFNPDYTGARDFQDLKKHFHGVDFAEKVWNLKEKQIKELEADLKLSRKVNNQHREINGNLRYQLSIL